MSQDWQAGPPVQGPQGAAADAVGAGPVPHAGTDPFGIHGDGPAGVHEPGPHGPGPHEPGPHTPGAPAAPDGGPPPVHRTAGSPAVTPFDPPGIAFQPVPQALAKARLISTGLTLAPFVVGAVLLAVLVGHWTLWALLGLVVLLCAWLAWLIPRQVRAMGYSEQAEDLLVRKGIFFRSLVVVPYGRMQQIDVEAGPLDRRFGIASVKLSTASAHTDAKIPGLPAEEAARLRESLTVRGEARLAGL